MAYDLEEQEQLDALKAWWNRYGNLITWLLIIVLAGYAAWSGWNYYQRRQAVQASQLYESLEKAVASRDNALVQRAASDMADKFGRTAYAEMGALAAAKSAFEANDFKVAQQRLQWVIDNGDDEYKAIARIRLAGVLLDQKNYDAGLKLLAGDFPAQYAGIVEDRKGDILVAAGKRDEARAAYQSALAKMSAGNPGRRLVQLKLDAIGGAPKAAA